MQRSTDNLLVATDLGRKLGDTGGITGVSLTLNTGDVLGLLGLNGAGKSTTLRLLAGTLMPDSGSISIAGHSLIDEPMLARQQIGFLPDNPPLYNDMRVHDYLLLAAKLRQVEPAARDTRIAAVVEQCDLNDVLTKRIAHLSKGYRQRVGLAQAMVHEPAVLLLDEPSNGLDPNQTQGMRDAIKLAGTHQSVVFSTHLLNEAQAVCNRIAVIHEGRLIHEAAVTGDNRQLEDVFTQLIHEQPTAAPA